MKLVLIALLALAPTSHCSVLHDDVELGRALAIIEYHDFRIRAAHRSWVVAGALTTASAGLGYGSRWVWPRLPVQILAASLLVPAVNMIILGLHASAVEVGGRSSLDRFGRFGVDRELLRPWREFMRRTSAERYEVARADERLRRELIELSRLLDVGLGDDRDRTR